MNGFPALDMRAAKRAERIAQAKEQAKLWANALKQEQLSACMFHLDGPLVDGFMLFLGAVDQELREQGYELASHSHAIVGQTANAPLAHFTFLVRARGEHAPRVMLA